MVNSSVTNASVELEGYKLYRLDRLGKIGAGVCAYIKITLKAEILNDLTEISVSGLHPSSPKQGTARLFSLPRLQTPGYRTQLPRERPYAKVHSGFVTK